MTRWLVLLAERLRPRARRVAVVVVALLVLGAAAAIVIVTPPAGVRAPSKRPPTRAPSSSSSANAGQKSPPSRVSNAQLLNARRIAERFLAGYLPFVYGRARAGSVRAITIELRDELIRERAQVTPVERRRHPRVTSLQVAGKTARLVLATVMIEDGGITTYALRFALERRAGGWAVSSVDGG
jgi:hypothetical protein